MNRGRNDFSPDNGAVMRRVRQWRKCANCIDRRSVGQCINVARLLCRLSWAAQSVLASQYVSLNRRGFPGQVAPTPA